MAAQFRWSEQEVSSRSEQQAAKPGDISCDFCTGPKWKAMKSCMKYHKNHEFVPLTEAYEGKKAELGKTEAEILKMIQQRRVKVEEIKQSAKLSREAADREKANGVQVFSALKRWVEKSQDDFIKMVEEKQRSSKKEAEGGSTAGNL
ncbi:hypothetical protein LDENG_00201140 [Lucifuga dentata]|nr:hypothetical protein LDENG_00201140 [Lucifuga dentata]